jgi:putative ABC transport system substrate-binding protein
MAPDRARTGGDARDWIPQRLVALRSCAQGFREAGYVESQTVAIEYRWAQDQYERLPDLAADLVRRQVAVIATHDTPSTIAAKAATTTIPIVFVSGGDPVNLGLVHSLSQPGGNVTGITFISAQLGAKNLGLLHELRPGATRIAVLVDPSFPLTAPFISEVPSKSTIPRSFLSAECFASTLNYFSLPCHSAVV